MKMGKKGFTLIELMIVISIIGVLAAIAIPNFRAARQRSNQRACYANQKTILGAIEMYNLDNGLQVTIDGYDKLKELTDKKYLQSVPDCPGCKQGDGTTIYASNDSGDVWCAAHGTIDGKCIATCVEAGTAGTDGMGPCP